jgi:hypothetical protein
MTRQVSKTVGVPVTHLRFRELQKRVLLTSPRPQTDVALLYYWPMLVLLRCRRLILEPENRWLPAAAAAPRIMEYGGRICEHGEPKYGQIGEREAAEKALKGLLALRPGSLQCHARDSESGGKRNSSSTRIDGLPKVGLEIATSDHETL